VRGTKKGKKRERKKREGPELFKKSTHAMMAIYVLFLEYKKNNAELPRKAFSSLSLK
jgi:hypothetical protein